MKLNWIVKTYFLLLLFSNGIKYYFGSEFGFIIINIPILVLILATNYDRISLTNFDWLVLLFIGLTILSSIKSLVIDDYYYSLAHIFLFMKTGIIFLYFRSLDKTTCQKLIYEIFNLIFTIVLVDAIVELLLFFMFSVEISEIPWSKYYRSVTGEEYYGNKMINSGRIPTLFGAPHKASLILAALLFLYLYKFNESFNKLRKLLIGSTLIIIIALKIRILIAYSIFGLIIYQIKNAKNRYLIILQVIICILVMITYSEQNILLSLSSSKNYTLTQNWENFSIHFKGIFSIDDLFDYIFGYGNVRTYIENIINIGDIEIALFNDLVPRYGLLTVFVYMLILYRLIYITRRTKNGFGLLLFMGVFYVGILHIWSNLHFLIFDMYILGIIYIENLSNEESSKCNILATAKPKDI